MTERKRTYISAFGVNHESADLANRERFYLSEIEYSELLKALSVNKIRNAFVLNTCNRTEIYTESNVLQKVIHIYRDVKKLDNEDLHNYTFIKYDKAAINHFFQVGAGLNSKILGDYQIIGQMRTAFNEAKSYGLIDTAFERLFQSLFIASKEISNSTRFNHGSASHGYQVATLINSLKLQKNSRILLLGAGDMAQKTLNHLRDYCNSPITIVNRSYSKLNTFNGLDKVSTSRLENLPYLIKTHDVIVSTIPIDNYLLAGQAAKLTGKAIFDLTVPSSIASLFNKIENNVYDIESIEQQTQETLDMRSADIPKVEQIIQKQIEAFYKWSKLNNQNKVFRLFEAELDRYIKSMSITDNALINTEEITQLFMKNYYSKLAHQKVG